MSKLSASAGAFAFAAALLGVACLTTIDESLIPCRTCEAGTGEAGEAGGDSNTGDGGVAHVGVRCGAGSACLTPKPVCCVVNLGENDYRNGRCDTTQDCPTGDYFSCTQPSDCPTAANLCCVVVRSGAFTRTECATICAGIAKLCDPAASSPCAGRACVASTTLPGLFECQ